MKFVKLLHLKHGSLKQSFENRKSIFNQNMQVVKILSIV